MRSDRAIWAGVERHRTCSTLRQMPPRPSASWPTSATPVIAYVDARPVGFVSGVEMTHPDKDTEMFLYELAVDEP